MRKKVAINGLGRIGKHSVRILLSRYWDTLDLVAINAPGYTAESAAYIINYDSVYGYFEEFDVIGRDGVFYINKIGEPDQVRRIQLFDTFDASTLPWKNLSVDLLIECSGAYKTHKAAYEHITAGATKMVLSSPTKDNLIPTIVMGANDTNELLKEQILSNASCTTNCVSPTLSVLLKNLEIEFVSGVTVHAYTQSQALLDKEAHKGLREGRAAGLNIIPTSTGAASAVETVLPALTGKLDLMSLRVPVPSGSVVYLNLTLSKPVSVEELNMIFKTASLTTHKDILFYSEEELVSSDIIGTPYSVIVDALSTSVTAKHARIVLWYDNEWGYTNRLIEVVSKMLSSK